MVGLANNVTYIRNHATSGIRNDATWVARSAGRSRKAHRRTRIAKFSEELSHARIFLVYLIDRRNSPHSQPPWHVPLRSSGRSHIGTVVQQDAYEAYFVQYARIVGIGRDSFV